jgi:hypothetical protein
MKHSAVNQVDGYYELISIDGTLRHGKGNWKISRPYANPTRLLRFAQAQLLLRRVTR